MNSDKVFDFFSAVFLFSSSSSQQKTHCQKKCSSIPKQHKWVSCHKQKSSINFQVSHEFLRNSLISNEVCSESSKTSFCFQLMKFHFRRIFMRNVSRETFSKSSHTTSCQRMLQKWENHQGFLLCDGREKFSKCHYITTTSTSKMKCCYSFYISIEIHFSFNLYSSVWWIGLEFIYIYILYMIWCECGEKTLFIWMEQWTWKITRIRIFLLWHIFQLKHYWGWEKRENNFLFFMIWI